MQKVLLGLLLLTGMSACKQEQEVHPVRKTIQQAVFASGYVTRDEEYLVSATMDGIIQDLHIREGDSVRSGQLLARIRSQVQQAQLQETELARQDAERNARLSGPRLSQLQQQIRQAIAQRDLDRQNYERYTALRASNSVAPLELEKATLQYRASETNVQVLQQSYKEASDALQYATNRSKAQVHTQQRILDEYLLRADKTGMVINVYKKQGELVRKGEVLARIGSGPYLLKLFIAEEDIVRVAAGQQVAVHLNTYPDSTFTATVSRILPAFDEAQQSYVAEAHFVQQPEVLLSGTQLQANIQMPARTNVLVIPAAAVYKGHYVRMKDGTERPIGLGQKLGTRVEVVSGLREQDVILQPKNPVKMQSDNFIGND